MICTRICREIMKCPRLLLYGLYHTIPADGYDTRVLVENSQVMMMMMRARKQSSRKRGGG